MITVDIPGFGEVAVEHLVCDYNGTLACDGKLLPEVASLFEQLSSAHPSPTPCHFCSIPNA